MVEGHVVWRVQSDGCIRVRREADEVMHTSWSDALPSSIQDLGEKCMWLWTDKCCDVAEAYRNDATANACLNVVQWNIRVWLFFEDGQCVYIYIYIYISLITHPQTHKTFVHILITTYRDFFHEIRDKLLEKVVSFCLYLYCIILSIILSTV